MSLNLLILLFCLFFTEVLLKADFLQNLADISLHIESRDQRQGSSFGDSLGLDTVVSIAVLVWSY